MKRKKKRNTSKVFFLQFLNYNFFLFYQSVELDYFWLFLKLIKLELNWIKKHHAHEMKKKIRNNGWFVRDYTRVQRVATLVILSLFFFFFFTLEKLCKIMTFCTIRFNSCDTVQNIVYSFAFFFPSLLFIFEIILFVINREYAL